MRARGRGHGVLSPARIKNRMRQLRALRMRLDGHSFDEIALALGYSGGRGQAWQSIQRELQRLASSKVDEGRERECAKLDVAEAALWDRVLAGSLPAIRVFITICTRRCLMLGLDERRPHIQVVLEERVVRIEENNEEGETSE